MNAHTAAAAITTHVSPRDAGTQTALWLLLQLFRLQGSVAQEDCNVIIVGLDNTAFPNN